jgi:GntR family transcriptional regulator / MocR family aminotransferase
MPRVSPSPDFPLPARVAGRPLHRWLYDELRQAILTGRLRAGARLPSSRSLAQQHHLSRTTVVAVYEQLQAEGYAVSRMGSGTVVAHPLPDSLVQAQRAAARRPATASSAPLSRQATTILGRPQRPDDPFQPFAVCVPGVDTFPVDEWARLTTRRLRLSRSGLLANGDPRGWKPLREAVAAHLNATRSVRCTTDQVVIVSGTQQAFDLIARLTLNPGDPVWMEEPGYPGAAGAFAAAGVRLVPVPVDGSGLNIRAGEKRENHPRLIYVTPAHQFPLGVTLSLERRLALLEFAHQAKAWIFEDDYDGEFRYDVRPIGALQGHDRRGLVIYAGTFNKMMFPTLRLGYLVLPPRLIDAYLALRDVVDRYLPSLEQAVLADFILEGQFDRHVRRSRALYQERRDALLAAAERHLAPFMTLQSTPAGFQLLASLHGGLTDHQVRECAQKEGVTIKPLSRFYSDPKTAPHDKLLLGFAAFIPKAIESSARRLAQALSIPQAARLGR